jgi:hypothetical protein
MAGFNLPDEKKTNHLIFVLLNIPLHDGKQQAA